MRVKSRVRGTNEPWSYPLTGAKQIRQRDNVPYLPTNFKLHSFYIGSQMPCRSV